MVESNHDSALHGSHFCCVGIGYRDSCRYTHRTKKEYTEMQSAYMTTQGELEAIRGTLTEKVSELDKKKKSLVAK